jgi:heme/copper-type cytochrome/quinol oxidase subunit 3
MVLIIFYYFGFEDAAWYWYFVDIVWWGGKHCFYNYFLKGLLGLR